MTMATGIVSVAMALHGARWLAVPLFAVNVTAYAILWMLTAARAAWFRTRLVADFMDHMRGVGFFTTVAGTSVLGVQIVTLWGQTGVALSLLCVAGALWGVITYGIFTVLTVKSEKPSLADGIHGGWLVAVVATESIANLAGLIAPRLGGAHEGLLFLSLAFWLFGGMLYIWMISLIFYRYTFFRFLPSDLMPPYWINMGAMAISTLAGTTLIAAAPGSVLLTRILPFLHGFTLFFWATATWWVPMLVILAFWRHVIRRFELAYDPMYWGAVFPMGMYSVSTLRLSLVEEAPFLIPLSRFFGLVALLAWSATFTGLLRNLFRALRTPKNAAI
ncbi:MAG: tellurite resistance/C4-dicarboxylate transporter family protein [Acidobacteria bacterium]|nr:tellurite resistance/C4-dicarboxylate transporter family protein [Acidobacteriota bacterium]